VDWWEKERDDQLSLYESMMEVSEALTAADASSDGLEEDFLQEIGPKKTPETQKKKSKNEKTNDELDLDDFEKFLELAVDVIGSMIEKEKKRNEKLALVSRIMHQGPKFDHCVENGKCSGDFQQWSLHKDGQICKPLRYGSR
jgi:hypothetical protein